MPTNRLNAIPRHRPALLETTGQVLSPEPDAELQRLVERASRELEMPMAVVSLVLSRIQLFRAHHGLPAELAAIGATARDVSFCQLVVRDEQLVEVPDAQADEVVPQELVGRYGVVAYIGAPIEIHGKVIGTLCALDRVPRAFSADARARLRELAAMVSARLGQLAGQAGAAAAPTNSSELARLHAELQPMADALALIRVAAAEVAAQQREARVLTEGRSPAVRRVLANAAGALDEVLANVSRAEHAAAAVGRALDALGAPLPLP